MKATFKDTCGLISWTSPSEQYGFTRVSLLATAVKNTREERGKSLFVLISIVSLMTFNKGAPNDDGCNIKLFQLGTNDTREG